MPESLGNIPTAPPRPVAYDVGEQRIADRTEQLAQVVNRLLATNWQLEREIRERGAAELMLLEKMEELQRALDREKELGGLKTRFITLASHEFRTPLSTILSSASLAGRYAEADNAEKRDQHLDKIRAAVAHLTGILHDFTTATQLEENKVRLRPENFDFASLVGEVIEKVKNLERPGLDIQFESEPTEIQVFTDKTLLHEVVQNLLTNAARFSKTAVKCCARKEADGTVKFEVRDNGIGIPEAEQRHIFERFFRASNADNQQGVGLGLHLSRRYLELIGGDISFESSEGNGTVFRIRFPMYDHSATHNGSH